MYGGTDGRQRYVETAVETAHPARLVVMLYDGAIRFLHEAEDAILKTDYERQNRYLIKTQHILTELMSSLNLQEGGSIAENLFTLYAYMHNRLIEANLTDHVETVRHVRKLLQELREAWDQVAAEVEGAPPITAPMKVSLHG